MSTNTETVTETVTEIRERPCDRPRDVGAPTRPRARRETVGELSAIELETELVSLAARLAVGTYELLVLVGEYDTRGTWALHGALSCARWLADLCDIEVCTARTQVRVAKTLRECSELDTAMRNGDVSYAKARVLVPWLTPRQRKVIDARQDHCQQPGCGSRNFLDYDHIHPYTRGGPTVLDNVQRLCGTHNRAKATTVVSGEPSK